MSQLIDLMNSHPRFGFATQYVLAKDNWNTFIGFHNYFEEIFPGQNITACVELVFHNSDGQEVLFHRMDIPPGVSVQIDCRALGVTTDGLVAIAATTNVDLEKLTKGNFKIQKLISAGFYVTWEKNSTWRDTMHEWATISPSMPKRSVQHIGFAHSRNPVQHGILMMNPSTCALPVKSDTSLLRLRKIGVKSETPTICKIRHLPPMGSWVLKMSDVFPNFEALVSDHGSLMIDLESQQAAPPFTVEWHESGDFHIHHI
jgi:hypothetical protein